MTLTKTEVAAISVTVAIGQVIKEVGSIPSGHLYARLMGKMSLENYNAIIDTLKKIGAVKEENHLLTYIGQ